MNYIICSQCGKRKPIEEFIRRTTETYEFKDPFKQCYCCRKMKLLLKQEAAKGITSKICSKCKKELPLESFHRERGRRSAHCRTCRHDIYILNKEKQKASLRTYYIQNKDRLKIQRDLRHALDPRKELLTSARRRAKNNNIPFNITLEDIHIPEFCPALKIPLYPGRNVCCDNSPTIDRLDCSRGYEKGNVLVLSYKANAIKRNATLEELKKLILFLEEQTA